MTKIIEPASVFAQIEGRQGSVWLDGGPDSWSIFAWDPVEQISDPTQWPRAGRALCRRRARRGEDAPFCSGVIGYIGYGAGHVVEPVPRWQPTPEPPVWLARYEGALCYLPSANEWRFGGSTRIRRQAERLLDNASALPPPPEPGIRQVATQTRADFEAAVTRVLDLVREGDCYQVNLTRAVHIAPVSNPFGIYRRLRAAPACYGACLRITPEIMVLSNSPELFVSLRGRKVRAEPIKGTRPRSSDPIEDRRLALDLEESPKDRSELTMIVDLVRNDLGKVATIGTVHTGERLIRSFPTVHHSTWPVYATLAPGLDVWDLLAATFPPGSVTGAPKVRACERIRELEPEPRGIYCGTIGYVDDGGDSTWSVAIRTAIVCGSEARYHVGGGIVVDSVPAAEWEETITKERALRDAFIGK